MVKNSKSLTDRFVVILAAYVQHSHTIFSGVVSMLFSN